MGGIAVLVELQANGRCEPGPVQGGGLREQFISLVKFTVVEIVFEIHIVLEFDLGFPVIRRPGKECLCTCCNSPGQKGRANDCQFFHYYQFGKANIARNSVIFAERSHLGKL